MTFRVVWFKKSHKHFLPSTFSLGQPKRRSLHARARKLPGRHGTCSNKLQQYSMVWTVHHHYQLCLMQCLLSSDMLQLCMTVLVRVQKLTKHGKTSLHERGERLTSFFSTQRGPCTRLVTVGASPWCHCISPRAGGQCYINHLQKVLPAIVERGGRASGHRMCVYINLFFC